MPNLQSEENQNAKTGAAFDAVVGVLNDYFDGIYFGDTKILAKVFHPAAMYACATDGTLLQLDMNEYFPVVEKRAAPSSFGQQRHDRIVSIEFASSTLAIARVECAILPKRFVDLLTMILLDGRWQIISKVFHFEIDADADAAK